MSIDFGNLLDMAGSASSTISNAVSAFSQVTQLAKDGKVPVEAAGDILNIAAQLSEPQVKLAHLESEIVRLQRAQNAVDEIERWKRNYVLAETPMGELVYRKKEGAETGEPAHDVCPACFEKDQKRILQPRGSVLQCDDCKANYRAKQDSGGAVVRTRNRLDGLF